MSAFDTLAFRRPLIDQREPDQPKVPGQLAAPEDLGLPLGGIGTGGITFAASGGFTRWTLKTAAVKNFREPACGFALWQKPAGEEAMARALQPPPDKAADGQLSAWTWVGAGQTGAWSFLGDQAEGAYDVLFPLAWHSFESGQHESVRLKIESWSPIVPGRLDWAGLPVAMFQCTLQNTAETRAEAAVMFHFANMVGWFNTFDRARPHRRNAGNQNMRFETGEAAGVLMGSMAAYGEDPPEGFGTMSIVAETMPGLDIAVCSSFDGLSDGAELWSDFSANGHVPENLPDWRAAPGFAEAESGLPSAAIAVKTLLAPGESRNVTFALAWDFPVISFGAGRSWKRAYTAQWGAQGDQAARIACHAIANHRQWRGEINAWHTRHAADNGNDPHRAGMMLNALSFLVDGAVWTARDIRVPSHFGLIECPDHDVYNPLDGWTCASEAVFRHWPELEDLVMDDFAGFALVGDATQRRRMSGGGTFPLLLKGALPRDLGGPAEDPFVTPNAYSWRDSTLWKDLNSLFVILMARDARRAGPKWLQRHFPAIEAAMDHLAGFDRDGDGLIENDGIADQSFDAIVMKGASAYCAGLWLAALLAGVEVARTLGNAGRARQWLALGAKGREAFDKKLWAGSHYRTDTEGPYRDCLFIEQLFGPFLALRYGFGEIVPAEQAQIALKALFDTNFRVTGQGRGAITLATRDGKMIAGTATDADPTVQTAEVLIGANLSFAAQLEAWGLTDEADILRRALYKEMYEDRNLAFHTPAAIDLAARSHRAPMNIRSLAVWYAAPWTDPEPDNSA
jgi:non-lysosomal glucosylceramidase